MAISIRFRRGGRANRPFYRIVVAEQTCPRDGRFIEALGFYDPIPHPETVKVDAERFAYWMAQGGNPTTSVKSILSRNGMWKDISVLVAEAKNRRSEQPIISQAVKSEIADTQPEIQMDEAN